MYVPYDVDESVKKECRRRKYSDKTIKAYLYWIHRFLKWSGKDLGKISKKDVRLFLEDLDNNDKAGSTLNQAHMAIKFLFEDIMDRKMYLNIKYSKVPEKIQRVLNKREVKKLIENIKNRKHKIMVALMYSAGLRVGELVNLKKEDLKLKKRYGFVRNGKGRKDRLFVIPEKLLTPLTQISLNKKDNDPIFMSNRGKKYSVRSLQKIIKKGSKKAGLENWKEIHPHTLRHSFATHLIEQGDSVSDVQAMLGHKSPETSLGYIHKSRNMINIESPFDSL